jgi:hypothetical protein
MRGSDEAETKSFKPSSRCRSIERQRPGLHGVLNGYRVQWPSCMRQPPPARTQVCGTQ